MTEEQKKNLQGQLHDPEYLSLAINCLADTLSRQLIKNDKYQARFIYIKPNQGGGKDAANHRGKRIQRQSGYSA